MPRQTPPEKNQEFSQTELQRRTEQTTCNWIKRTLNEAA